MGLLLLVGIFQCMGCGWGFDVFNKMALTPGHEKAIKFLTLGFWIALCIWGILFVCLRLKLIGLLTFIPVLLVLLVISKVLNGLPAGEWFEDVMMCGVAKI